MLRKLFLLLLPVLVPALVLAAHTDPKLVRPLANYPLLTGDEVSPVAVSPPYLIPATNGVDLEVGDTLSVGTTWYENQHNGTCGRMNLTEASGWRQFVWMNGENQGSSTRHVWWNAINPAGQLYGSSGGYRVESFFRGGFANLDVWVTPGGTPLAVPGYHITESSGANPASMLSLSQIPHTEAFQSFTPPRTPVTQMIWPRIQISPNGRLYIINTQSGGVAGAPQRQYFIGATIDSTAGTINYDPSWTFAGWTMTIAADLATSPVSNKVLVAWTYSEAFTSPDTTLTYTQRDNDIFYAISPNGATPNFSQPINLTNFIRPDTTLLPDTLAADKDTLRAYTDISTFIDRNDYAHLAFTTGSYFSFEGTAYFNASIIWHWSEQYPDSFRMIANFFDPTDVPDCGAWNLRAQRPSLGQDSTTGNLYCVYQVYDTDTTRLSTFLGQNGLGFPSGEIYASVSTDGGPNWSQGVNLTNTLTPSHAPTGSCLSEICPTLSKKVRNGALDIEYILDHDAGNSVQTNPQEGAATLNQVIYHRVPLNLIPTTPLVVQDKRLHIGPVTAVGPEPGRNPLPNTFALKQNFPNPFNPSTSITFVLDAVSDISLDVFNTRGQLVANVVKGIYSPGEHTVTFDARTLASGIYFCKLTAGPRTALQKMAVVK